MQPLRPLAVLGLCLALTALALPARSAPITWVFEGQVEEISPCRTWESWTARV